MSNSTIKYTLALGLLLLMLTACGQGNTYTTTTSPGPYKMTFNLDGTFHTDHGGDPIRIALVQISNSSVIAEASGTVSASVSPSFTFSTAAVMHNGVGYAVHYWIDSNIGGGTPGTCDATSFDHQWSTEFPNPTNHINFTVSYQPALVEDVCSTFP